MNLEQQLQETSSTSPKSKRYVIELDMYLNAESDAEAKVLAKKFQRLIDKELDNSIKVQRIIEPSINQIRIIR